MKALIDALMVATFLFASFLGGKYTLKQTANYVQNLALEKAARGLGDLEPATRKMTGKKLDF
jgi:hypothetical protein